MSAVAKYRVVADLSELPLHGMGSASPTWWGTLAFMLIEGTGFALVIGVYLYLASLASTWPLSAPLPSLGPGTALTLLLLVSMIPNILLSRWADQGDLRKVRIGLVVMSVLGALPLLLRWFEFPLCTSPGTATPTARSPGRCSACTRRTSSPTSPIRWCSQR
jgi:cytochrome c oxidase subunit III